MHIDAQITIVCESVRAGCEFRALFYDRPSSQFYGGSGPTALDALAWCMHEYVRRGVLGGEPIPAMPSDARPGYGLVIPALAPAAAAFVAAATGEPKAEPKPARRRAPRRGRS